MQSSVVIAAIYNSRMVPMGIIAPESASPCKFVFHISAQSDDPPTHTGTTSGNSICGFSTGSLYVTALAVEGWMIVAKDSGIAAATAKRASFVPINVLPYMHHSS